MSTQKIDPDSIAEDEEMKWSDCTSSGESEENDDNDENSSNCGVPTPMAFEVFDSKEQLFLNQQTGWLAKNEKGKITVVGKLNQQKERVALNQLDLMMLKVFGLS
jgi:hypothetical protein